jgi:hypothetical protein
MYRLHAVGPCSSVRYVNIHELGRAMAQAVSRHHLIAETRVRARVNPGRICGIQSVHWDRVFSEFFRFLLPIYFHRVSPYSDIIWSLVAIIQRHSLAPST